MKLSKSIHFLSNTETLKKNSDKTILGIRGRQLNEFSELGLPVVPGIILDADSMPVLQKEDAMPALRP